MNEIQIPHTKLISAEVYMMESNPTETSAQIYATTRNEHFEFKVAACSNVKIVLISEIGGVNSTYYQIGIGYNDNTNITIIDSKIGRIRYLICTKGNN